MTDDELRGVRSKLGVESEEPNESEQHVGEATDQTLARRPSRFLQLYAFVREGLAGQPREVSASVETTAETTRTN